MRLIHWKRQRALTLLMSVLALGGCGWHLRGNVQLPEAVRTAYIVTEDEYTDFYRELRRTLLEAGARLAASPKEAHAIVRVRGDTFGQRVVAVSARNTPQEFQVFYAVDYSLDLQGAEAVPTQHIELSANYSYDTTAVLAKQREQRTMQVALARELAVQVLRRLATATEPSVTDEDR